jgi:hypothetical protein
MIGFNQESLSLFEVIIDSEVGNEDGVQAVEYALSLSQLLLYCFCSLLFELVEDDKGIRL